MAQRRDPNLMPIIAAGAMFTLALAACVVLAKQAHPAEALLGGVIVLAGMGLAIAVMAKSAGGGGGSGDADDVLHQLRDKVEELSDTVREMAAHSALSQDARRVLFRKQERALLVQAIDEDLREGQWDAATVLVNELADRLGYKAEAEAYRAKIGDYRAGRVTIAVPAPKTDDVVAEVPVAVNGVPPVERSVVTGAAVQVESPSAAARTAQKQELEQRFMAAAAQGRAEDAMSVLAELDQYLTPEEAQPLLEIARGVIAKTRDTKGEQFKAAVQEKRWREAVTVGEEIVSRFPNTRMASEVRDVIDALKSRAGA